ncbi:MAG: FAD-dependent oxidoreductase [Planctomycetaceae bacterium]
MSPCVLKAMLKDAGVAVHTGRYLKSVTMEGPHISSLVTRDGTFEAEVFIDGTYEGDLMAAAGVDWTIGREGRAEFDESYAGKRYPKARMNINGLDSRVHPLPLADD